MKPKYSEEFAFLLDVCRTYLGTGRLSKASRQFAISNPEAALMVIRRHRLVGIALKALEHETELASIGKLLGDLKQQTSFKAMQQVRLLAELKALFSPVSLDFMTLKGVAFSHRAYGDIGMRSSRDVDILVKPAHLLKCHDTLVENGFDLVNPKIELTQANAGVIQRLTNQLSYLSPGGQYLEVHWRLFKFSNQIPITEETIWSEAETIQIANHSFLVLGETIQFRYMMVHGAKHQYASLYWLMDIAIILKNAKLSMASELAYARRNNTLRSLILTLELLKRHFAIQETDKYEMSKGTERMVEACIEEQLADDSVAQGFFTRIKQFWFRLKLKAGVRDKFAQIQLVSIGDYQLFALPSGLLFLYPLLKPFLFIYKNTLSRR